MESNKHPEIYQRVMSYAGKKRNQVTAPHITANETITLANEIEKINKRLKWLSFHGAWIGWDREGDRCRVFVDGELGKEAVCGWDNWFFSAEEAIDCAINSATDKEILKLMNEKAKPICDRLFEKIKHGDEEHQKWLKDALKEFFNV